MKYQKPYLNDAEKIVFLQQHGMIVKDEGKAQKALELIGFSRFLGYATAFADEEGKFLRQTNFYAVLSVCRMDTKLRGLLFAALEKIELALRSSWTGVFCANFGPLGYLDPGHFEDAHLWDLHLQKLRTGWANLNDVAFKQYITKYDAPPLWFAVPAWTLGSLSKWIVNSPATVQTEVWNRLGLGSMGKLHGVLKSLTILRNFCAHHIPVWDAYFPIAFPDYRNDKVAGGKKIYHAIELIFMLLHRLEPESRYAEEWKENVNKLVSSYPAFLKKAMGFPKTKN